MWCFSSKGLFEWEILGQKEYEKVPSISAQKQTVLDFLEASTTKQTLKKVVGKHINNQEIDLVCHDLSVIGAFTTPLLSFKEKSKDEQENFILDNTHNDAEIDGGVEINKEL